MGKRILALLSAIGIVDTYYLIQKQTLGGLAPCGTGFLSDCSQVLTSKYSTLFGVPLSKIGFAYYILVFILSVMILTKTSEKIKKALLILVSGGFGFSIYLVYLQIIVIKAICVYCMLSALTSTLLFLVSVAYFKKARIYLFGIIFGLFYKYLLKPIFFKINPEIVHESTVSMGSALARNKFTKSVINFLLNNKNASYKNLAGINFSGPVGLAAGFDYDAKLTQSLDMLGFGFQTVGTVTNLPYEGNPRPMLGRLPKSKSLMVNKGFKSVGAKAIAEKLKGKVFPIPLGISIGRSNNSKLKTQNDSIKDIVAAFKTFERAKIRNSFYELNISCPNLIHGNVSFYPPKNLENLLKAIDKLKIKKPIFIKMPIEKTDNEVLSMLRVIGKHNVAGVIFGNLQKDRKNKALHKDEVKKFSVGNFSGKPTFARSNELIELTKKRYKNRFVIIGCGGVFSAQDAQIKIDLGADLIQLITGMIFEGPQLISQINSDIQTN